MADGGSSDGGICVGADAYGVPCCLANLLNSCAGGGDCTYEIGDPSIICFANGVRRVSQLDGSTTVSQNGVVCYTYTVVTQGAQALITYSNPQGQVVGTQLSNSAGGVATCTGGTAMTYTNAPSGPGCAIGSCGN
jgi:hypothetical protein